MSRTDNFISTSASQNLKPLRYPDCIYLTEHCRCGILRVSRVHWRKMFFLSKQAGTQGIQCSMASAYELVERGEAGENCRRLLWGQNAMEGSERKGGWSVFQVNDMIVYGAHGVCRIAEIEERDFNGSSIEYYILKPVYDEKATIFVPVLNDRLTAKMRRVLSKDEIEALIESMPNEDTLWIENEMQRKERYKEIVSRGIERSWWG
ncbi:MAG: CarD family transcriptional regulator [Clostridia bacterium]